MSTRSQRERISVGISLVVATLLLAGCEMPIALQPRGQAARSIADIWWILFWTALVITVVVFVLLGVALARSSRGHRAPWAEERNNAFVLIGGAAVPAVILVGTTLLTFGGLSLFDRPPEDAEITINITGHTFWWEAEYEEDSFSTANEIHIPVGRPVRLHLESHDVIHSFWVPQLAGKIEMIPGWTNVLYLEADEPGVYFGKCAEFCGTQHANMEFLVVALAQEEFENWRDVQRSPAREPETALETRGREVFLTEPCSLCHTIRGVNHATTEVGPDLTHLASRSSLAARTLPNTEGALAGWIADPQGVKPGNHMPSVNLSSQDLIALVAYLRSLE